jgi:hypothetical protein
MLNYPFPYDSLPVINQFEKFSKALYRSISSLDSKEYKTYLKQYIKERNNFRNILSPSDYRYFSFQVWQEGLARYAEYKFLEMLSDYKVSKEVAALPDFISFAELKTKMYRNETRNLLEKKLRESKRVSFYSIGFAEGIILDRLNKQWRKKYLTDKFYIESYSKKYKH